MATWFSILIGTRMTTMDNCENLFDWSRTLLERVGYRMGLDSIVILLTGSKIGQLMSNGTELQNVNVSMQDLYLKPESHKPLQSYWTSGCMPPATQIASAKQTLCELSGFPVGSLIITCLLHELQLVIFDLECCKP